MARKIFHRVNQSFWKSASRWEKPSLTTPKIFSLQIRRISTGFAGKIFATLLLEEESYESYPLLHLS